ncbi:hypothetical protein V8G54_008366 [Vigna mungo]|uniref:Integrase catalytic domain-containing protein n=1 Tax=Vigna mungo TaxID=3915 RepID=A0AAQ3P3D2_VIGMU
MSEKNSTPKLGSAVTPVIIQSESAFNVGIVLSETNYNIWSQIMEMHIAERETLSYIRGKEKQPAEEDPGYEKWYAENQKVKRWLLLSMSPEIMKRYLHLATTHEIWSALSKAFYDGSDEVQVFTLNQKAFTAKQNGRPLSEYYIELMENFQELDYRDKVIMKDPEDVTAYKKSIGRLRVHIFLAGLDGEFEQIRGEILRKEPVPELENSYALVPTLKGESESSDSTAMIARNRNWQGQTKGNHPKANSNIDNSNRDQRRKNPAATVVEEKNIDEASKDFTTLMAIRGNDGHSDRQTIGYGVKQGRLYYLDLVSKDSGKLESALTMKGPTKQKEETEIWLWHPRLGHASFSYLKKLFPLLFTKIDISVFHCDGPSKISTLRGSRWFVTFIDDCTRMTWLWLMKSKGEVNLIFQKFHKMIETQYNAKVQVLCSDNGGEYQSLDLKRYLEVHGIIHQTMCPNTPQQNGVAERKNRHLLEVVRSLLLEAHMPLSYWGEALTMATYVINCIPSSSNEFQTPLQTLLNKVVALGSTDLPPRVFGCVAFVHIQKNPNKLAPRAL